MSIDVVKAEELDEIKAAKMLASSFGNDPLFSYLISEKEKVRENILSWLFESSLRYFRNYKHIYTSNGELKGVAIWVPPGKSANNLWLMMQSGFLLAPFKFKWSKFGRLIKMLTLQEKQHKQHMSNTPHWYLALLGVAPEYQGKGIGANLIKPILEEADKSGIPCYLETSTQGAVKFYQRHGFEIAWTGKLDENGPQLWTMKRNPVKTA